MDAWDRYEVLVKTLTKNRRLLEISREFLTKDSVVERVHYAKNLLIEYNFLPFADVIFRNEKNDLKSVELRKQGNENFSLNKKDYCTALERYNESICFAEPNSENLSIGYANRSAVYFEWNEYELCLENIRLAKENNYPARLMPKLLKREHECNEAIKDGKTRQPIEKLEMKLSHSPNPKVPFISEYLEYSESDNFGRYVTATKDLNAGDVVAIEKPYSLSILSDQIYLRCANCLQENKLSLIPCDNCTCAMYCSTACKAEAFEKYHKYECDVIDAIYQLCTKINLIALRTVLTAIQTFDNLDNLAEFISTIDNKEINSFTLNYKNFDQREYYSAIHNLATNQEDRSPTDLFQRACLVAIIGYLMLKYSKLADVMETEENINTFIELMFRHFQTAPVNMHSVYTISVDPKSKKLLDNSQMGSGSFAFMSLINHSCAPNVVRVCQGTTIALVLNRPVAKGGQLFDNYGYHHCLADLATRQDQLKLQYLFECKCEACENNYPLYYDLKAPRIPDIVSEDDMNKLLKLDRDVARKRIPEFQKFLNDFQQHYPCYQLSFAQESLLRCYTILTQDVPLRRKY